MTQSKLGTGANYAGITGFTWPANTNPSLFNIRDTKRHDRFSYPYSDINVIMDSGSEDTIIGLTGELFTEANLNSLRKQIKKTSLDAAGEIQDFNQKLYLNSNSKFRWVRGQQFVDARTASKPTSYPYVCTLIAVHPFIYHDTVASKSDTTTNTTLTLSGADLDNDGTAYVFPFFEITNNAGSDITKIEITDGTNTITWNGTLEAGKSVRIFQESNPDYGLDGWICYLYTTTDFSDTPTAKSGLTGNKIYFDFTLTGNDNTATCAVKFRERDY